MPISVTCPSCQAGFRVRDEFAGRQGKCTKCGAVVAIPALASNDDFAVTAPVVAPESVPTQPSNVTHSDDFSLPTITASADEHISRHVARRKKGYRIPVWGWFAAGGACLLLIVGYLVLANRSTNVAQRDAHRAGSGAPRGSSDRPARPFFVVADVATPQKPQAGAPLEDVVEYVKHGIVKIETSNGANQRQGLGSGFIVDAANRLVATNYHVIARAMKADVVFSDGTRYGIEGYVAMSPESDLALLKLNGLPVAAKSLDLKYAEGPREASRVYAIGHPHNHEFTTTEGIIGRVLRSDQLPKESHDWLIMSEMDNPENVWVQHDAKISPGNSGGPLINSQGDVVGVNSWVNQQLGFGYAIHAKHLNELLGKRSAEVTPLSDQWRSLAATTKPHFEGLQLAADRVRALREQWSGKNWRPRSERECGSLDELARFITAAKYIESNPELRIPMPADERETVMREISEVVDEWRGQRWQDGHISRINAHASRKLRPYSGILFFGAVTDRVQTNGDQSSLVVNLSGSEEMRFFLPLDPTDSAVAIGDRVLVVGILHPDSVQIKGEVDEFSQARIVLSKVVLPLAK